MEIETHTGLLSAAPKLSICITTRNRAAFIKETLESILVQATDDCEVVVLDGASIDDTKEVVSQFTARSHRVRYVRQDTNSGFDRDCSRAVELAIGEYCWLMTDDDLLKRGAIAAVLEALSRSFCFLFVNVEGRSFDMSKVVEPRCLDFESDRVYGSGEIDRLFAELGGMLTYVGGVVIKRSIWLARGKEAYYGSMFLHVGVVFQAELPGEALVISEPFISYRMGNVHTWSAKTFETFVIKWPAIVWSLPLSPEAKGAACRAEPWKSLEQLMSFRGRGCYSLVEYRRHIRPRLGSTSEMIIPVLVAVLPGALANAVCLLYYSFTKCPRRGMRLQFMRESRYHIQNWRVLERIVLFWKARRPVV